MTEVADVVIVLSSAYALFVGTVLVAVRRPAPRPGRPVGGRGLGRYVATTVAGGYLAFLLIVVMFHTWLVEERDALGSAVPGGAFLAACSLVAFAALSWAEGRLRG